MDSLPSKTAERYAVAFLRRATQSSAFAVICLSVPLRVIAPHLRALPLLRLALPCLRAASHVTALPCLRAAFPRPTLLHYSMPLLHTSFLSVLCLRRAQRRKHIDARPCVAVAMLCCHCRRLADPCLANRRFALALPGYAAAFLVLALPLPCIPALRFALAFLSCASQAFLSISLAAHSSSSGMSSSTGFAFFAFFAFFAALFPAMTFPAPSI